MNASAILDFKIHKSLVQKLVGYFAKCHGADKSACFLVFKIWKQVVKNAVARKYNIIRIQSHNLARLCIKCCHIIVNRLCMFIFYAVKNRLE